MLLQLYKEYKNDLHNEDKFKRILKKLEPKILSIYKTINCPYDLKEDFVQDCHLKIFQIAKNKNINFTNVYALDRYFERAFMTAKQGFIKKYHLDTQTISLDALNEYGDSLIDTIVDTKTDEELIIESKLEIIKANLNEKDYQLLKLILNKEGNKNRSLTEVAKLLGVTPQAIYKRFKKVRDNINSLNLF